LVEASLDGDKKQSLIVDAAKALAAEVRSLVIPELYQPGEYGIPVDALKRKPRPRKMKSAF
jgi:hypothetical protein